MRKRLAAASALALSLALSTGTVAANAQVPGRSTVVHSGACNSSQYFNQVTSSSSTWIGLTTKFVATNATNTAMSATFHAQKAGSYSSSLTGTVTGGINSAIVTAQGSVSKAITKSVSWTASVSITTPVPAHSSRYAQYGTTRYTVNERTAHYTNACVLQVTSTGKLTAPGATGWRVTSS